MKYLKKYKLFESIILKDEFPSVDDIMDYFYDFSDEVGDYMRVDIQQLGYTIFPSDDIYKNIKNDLTQDIDKEDWLNIKPKSLYSVNGGECSWSEFFKPVTNLKNWDIPDFISTSLDDGYAPSAHGNLYKKMYDKIILGDIPAYPTIYMTLRGFYEKDVDLLIECLERFYESTGFRPIGDLKKEDYVDEDNGDIITLYTAELKLCKCDDIEYKSLINHLGEGIKSKNVGTSGPFQTTVNNENPVLLKKFL